MHQSGLTLSEILRSQNDGCLNFVDENDEVLISGFGRRGKAKGDIPGVRFKVVKVSGVGLLALWKEKKVRVYAFLHPESAAEIPHPLLGKAPLIIPYSCHSASSYSAVVHCHTCIAPPCTQFRMKLKPTH
jgi:hypothetical protein